MGAWRVSRRLSTSTSSCRGFYKVKMDGSYYASSNQATCGGLIRDSLSVPIAIFTSKDHFWDGFSCGGLYHLEIKISTSLFCYDHLLLISGSICLWRIETLLSLIFIKRLIWVLIFLENLGHQDNFVLSRVDSRINM